jgi:hypothetical protein
MVTNKVSGRPLIDTGQMLRSISVNDNQAVVNVPYAQEVQDRTGNTFISKPTQADWEVWLTRFLRNQ